MLYEDADMTRKVKIKWLKSSSDKDFDAARRFLEILYGARRAKRYVARLKDAPICEYLAKDILRASGTSLLELQAFDWTKQHDEIRNGTPLSPILLIRREKANRIVVADGFHRLCASFTFDEQSEVRCLIA